MKFARRICLFAFLMTVAVLPGRPLSSQEGAFPISSGDPLQGKTALASKGCITCHSVWGVGGRLGPDLAAAGAEYSFQQMASMFWNHTPRMVQLLKQKGMDWPVLGEQEMANIISFIYYIKMLDRPGDAERGRVLFREKKCLSCHPAESSARGEILRLGDLGSFISSVHLAQAMWNSGRAMEEAQRARGIAMPLFEGREMADLQAYIRSARDSSGVQTTYLPLPDISRGGEIFRSKGCVRCHTPGAAGGLGPDLAMKPLRKSISEICGILWNHSFAMQARMAASGVAFPRLSGNDLADLLGYIYFLHFSRDRGDAARGEIVFREKGCAGCHTSETGTAPVLARGEKSYNWLQLATSMWNHAPIMFEAMEREVMKWIKLDPDDMQDLSRFLRRAGPSR